MRWLTSAVLTEAQNGDTREQVRATALWGFTHVFDLLQPLGQWLTTEAAKQLDIARQAALQGYNCLSAACCEAEPVVNRYIKNEGTHVHS